MDGKKKYSSGTPACYFWVSHKKRKHPSLESDQEFSLHRQKVYTKQTLQVSIKGDIDYVNVYPPSILTDLPNKVTNYTQWLTEEFGFYCSLLPLIQTNNSLLNPTQETRNQTGILYKALSFFKKTSQEWSYKYFHGTLLLFEIYVWRNNSRTWY